MKNSTIKSVSASLAVIALLAVSGCGQKGPLVLEQIPVDQVQAPLENSIDQIPVEKPAPVETTTTENTSQADSSDE